MRQAEELDTIDAVAPAAEVRPEQPEAALAVDPTELVAAERGRYAIAKVLAKGGMGRVLEARDLRLDRDVAIKELLPQHRDVGGRFEREARITARLQHPSIIHVYEAGTWPAGGRFYAMPKIDGRSLDKVVAERGSLAERLGLIPHVIAVADALAYAHHERVIHRDLKPGNVLVGAYGETVVIDWGMAKDLKVPHDPMESIAFREVALRGNSADDTTDGSIVGTPAYMPPEQAKGSAVDQRADVYALGALLYHVLVGAAPYTGRANEVLELVKRGPCTPVGEREPGVPRDLVAIVTKAMAREPADRYADAGELAVDLKRFATGQLVAAHHYTRRQLAWRWLRRHRLPVTIAATAVLTIAIVVSVSFVRILREQHLNERRRDVLLEARGREELLAGHAGKAAAYITGRRGEPTGATSFVLADAMRPFDARILELPSFGTARRSAAFSPDGALVATAIGEGTQLWRADGTAAGRCSHDGEGTRVIAFDPGGARYVAAGNSGIGHVCKLDGTLVAELRHGRGIADAAWSPDGARIVTAGDDATARIWNAATGAELGRLARHREAIASARFSPDGESIATAGADGAYVWRVATDEMVALRGHAGAVRSIRWSADGNLLLTAAADGARVFDAALGKPVTQLLRHDGQEVLAAEWSIGGALIATGGADRTARIWEAPAPPQERRRPDAEAAGRALVEVAQLQRLEASATIASVAFSADDDLLATSDGDGVARVWQIETGQPIAAFEHPEAVDATFAPGDARRRVLSTGKDGFARLWDLEAGRVDDASHEVGNIVHAVAAAGGVVAMARHDGRVRLAAEKQLLQVQLGTLLAVAISADAKHLFAGGVDGTVSVYELPSRRLEHRLRVDSTILALASSGDVIAAAGDDRLVRTWSAATGAPGRTLRHDRAVATIAMSPDGNTIAGVDADGRLVVWGRGDAGSAEKLTHGAAQVVAFSPDGARLAIGSTKETRVFPIEDGAIVRGREIVVDGPTGAVSAIAFTADGSCLITGSTDGGVRLWDAAKGKLVGTRGQPGTEIHGFAVAGDRLWVATQAGVRQWKIGVEGRGSEQLRRVVADRVPWELDDVDVVRRKSGTDAALQRGATHGER